MYTVKVNSVLKLNRVAKFVAIGVSFRQARKLYRTVKEETGRMGSLGSVSDGEIAQRCRIVCAINLRYMKELFKEVWTFSMGLDDGNTTGSSYHDIRMLRCFFKGDIQNLQRILAIPMRGRATYWRVSVQSCGYSAGCPCS